MTHTKLLVTFAAIAVILIVKLFSNVHTAAVKIQHQQADQLEQALKDAGV